MAKLGPGGAMVGDGSVEESALGSAKKTLEYRLRRSALPSGEMVRRHPAVVPLVARILGVVPRVFAYMEIWPPAFETYSLVVPSFFDLPFCDLGMGMGARARSLVAYSSSRGHGCMYCAAHCAALGNVFTGAGGNLTHNAAAIRSGVCQVLEGPDRVLVEYGLAVGKGSAAATMEVRALAAHYAPEQIEQIVLVAATMGLLNRCLDTLGMVLEGPMLKLGRSHLAETGWDEASTYQEDFDRELLEGEEPAPVLGPLGLARALWGAVRFESRHLGGYASSRRGLRSQAREKLGFCPEYLLRFSSSRARKTLLYLMTERLLGPAGSLSPGLRCVLCLIFARVSENFVLQAHFAFLLSRAATSDELERWGGVIAHPVSTEVGTFQSSTPLESACWRAAIEASKTPVCLTGATVDRLGESLDDQQIVQFVLTLGVATALGRIVLSYPQDLEPEVAAFVAADGESYGLARTG